ncbi:MAG: phytoene/squalene synthase family protein [Janthinobacterium lividum]
MSRQHVRALDAAAATDPALYDPSLRAAFELCRGLNAEHGKTYYLATLLLPREKRPYVWALYGFARYADEFVDSMTAPDPDALVRWSDAFLTALNAPEGPVDPVGRAMIATMRRWDIPQAHVVAFLDSMRMDITETSYPTYDDLRRYVYGSAAVIGLEMLPVLGTVAPGAEEPARALGEAFQLSNFIRDVGEDLDRGRIYLPMEDLEAFGVTREQMLAGRRAGTTPQAVRDLLAFETQRTRELYAQAEPGIAMVEPSSRDCLRTAFELYGGILDAVADTGYDVLSRRVHVGLPRRLAVALPALGRARLARWRESRWVTV